MPQHDLPYRRLAGFYFFYFAYLGAFAPFFSLYLDGVGLSAVEIGVVMALPPVTRIVAPHLWGWLADAADRPPARLVRVDRAGGTLRAGWVCSRQRASSGSVRGGAGDELLPERGAAAGGSDDADPSRRAHRRATARSGVWGSIGFIVAVVGVGYALDCFPARALLWIVPSRCSGRWHSLAGSRARGRRPTPLISSPSRTS